MKQQRKARAVKRRRAEVLAYFSGSPEEKATGLFQLLDETGACDTAELEAAGIDRKLARSLYEGMVAVRTMDERLLALQRQGRIGFYAEIRGQEAATIGSAAAMKPQDWLVPALREAGAGVFRGLPLSDYVSQIFGNAQDVCHGRQMPCHPTDREHNYVNMSSCVASQIPHAVGIAWAMKLSGDTDKACVGYLGDGATSEAEFHAAANFAGVLRVPVVLICQNNQWAISTPSNRQTASETYAIKGLGYGMESLRVDGNDAFAVYAASKYALDKARRGDGPSFLELLTYRVSAHTSSDDPSRYRDESVTDVWREQRDPIARLHNYLLAKKWLTLAESTEMRETAEQRVREVIGQQEKVPPPALDSLVEDVYESPTWLQTEQLAQLKRER